MATNNQVLKILLKSTKQILVLQIERLDQLSVKDFPYSTPKEIIKLMHSIFSQILDLVKKLENDLEKNKIDKKSLEIDLRLFTKFIFTQNETLNMLESSTREKVSQNTVFLIKYFTSKFPHSRFLITATYEHNFSITYWGQELQKKIKNLEIDISQFPKPESYFILSFPSVFKENLVANSILGHELGHFMIQDENLLNGEHKPNVKYSPKLEKLVESKIKEAKKENIIPENVTKASIEQYYSKKIKKDVTFGIEEILSDLIGLRLFGPVILFALNELLLINSTGDKISEKGYPPPILRLKVLIEEIKSIGYISQIKNSKLKNVIKEIIESISNYTKISNKTTYDLESEIKLEAWKKVIPELKKIAKNATKEKEYSKSNFGYELPLLVEKLADLIPPCEIKYNHPANLISILNAGMIFRIAWEKLTKKKLGDIETKIDSLVLRGAEQSIIAQKLTEALETGRKGGL